MRIHRAFFLAVGILACAAASSADPALERALDHADRNGDGRVDRREFDARMVDVFFALDADKDGALVIGELPGCSAEVFAAADANGDGVLQLEEFLEARAHDFDRADADDDGALDPAEAEAYGRAARGP